MNKKSAVVIIPTTGADTVKDAIESVLNQTYPTKALVVVDGNQFQNKSIDILYPFFKLDNVEIVYLQTNVGANGFYGHRIYAAFSHLVNEDYILFLDQDNWIEPNHVESLVTAIETNNSQWSYTLRNIMEPDGTFVCRDDCESLGKWPMWKGDYAHIDTSCYCLPRQIAVAISSAWHGSWGQDRIVYQTLRSHFNNYSCNFTYIISIYF